MAVQRPIGRRSPARVLVVALLAAWVAAAAGAGPAAAATRPLVVSHGPHDRRVVALTIDDCWNSATVLEMVAMLQREQVNATFLPVGRAVAAYPKVWKAVADAGFPIANHTYSHAYLTRQSVDWIVADIRKNAALILRVTGKPMVPILRPPMGEWGSAAYRAASITNQKALVLWDTSFNDTGRGTSEEYATAGEKGDAGSIILLHANRMKSAVALELAIKWYRDRDFGFVTLPELLGIDDAMPYPAFRPKPPPPDLEVTPPAPLPARPCACFAWA